MCYARATPDGGGYAINLSAKNFGFATEKNRAALHRILYLIFLSARSSAAWREGASSLSHAAFELFCAAVYCARYRNVTICALVQAAFGLNWLLLVPPVISI